MATSMTEILASQLDEARAEIARLESGIRAWNERWGMIEAAKLRAEAERDALLRLLVGQYRNGRWFYREWTGCRLHFFDTEDEAKAALIKAASCSEES